MMPVCEADLTTILPSRIRGIAGGSSPSRLPGLLVGAGKLFLTDGRSQPMPWWINFCVRLIFPGLWLFIGLVSAVDTYLTVKFKEWLCDMEANPLARML